jgi:hypothetical protein
MASSSSRKTGTEGPVLKATKLSALGKQTKDHFDALYAKVCSLSLSLFSSLSLSFLSPVCCCRVDVIVSHRLLCFCHRVAD